METVASNTSVLSSEMFLVFTALLQNVQKDVNVSFHCLPSDMFLMSDQPLSIRLSGTHCRT